MNRTVRSFSIVTGFSILTRLISFIFKIWMSRSLGAETVGLYQISLSVLMLLFTLTSGAPTVLSRKVAENAGNLKRQNAYATASILLGVIFSGTLFAIIFALKGKIGFLFSDERCLPIFLIMLPTLITSTLYSSLRSWFWGRKSFFAFSSTELLDEIIRIILSVIFAGGIVASVSGAYGIALAMTLSDAVCVIVIAIMYFISGGRLCRPYGFKELTLSTLPLSMTRIITSVTTSLTALVIPQMMIKSGVPVAEATAEYGRAAGMALPLIMAPVMFISSLSVVMIPDVAELRVGGQLDPVRKKLSNSLSFAILIAVIFFILYLPLGRHIGYILFKDQKAGEFVSYCSAMLFPIAITQVTMPMLNSLGKEKLTLLSTLCGSALIIPCMLLLPKYVGVYAMAIGSAACFTLMSIINLLALRRAVGRFANPKKLILSVALLLPIALIGFFTERLISPKLGSVATLLTIGILEGFFIFITINAFNIVDISGFVHLVLPKKTKKL